MAVSQIGYSVGEVADMLRVTNHQVLAHIASGVLVAVNVGRKSTRPRWLITEGAINDFLTRRATNFTEDELDKDDLSRLRVRQRSQSGEEG